MFLLKKTYQYEPLIQDPAQFFFHHFVATPSKAQDLVASPIFFFFLDKFTNYYNYDRIVLAYFAEVQTE